MRDLFNNPNLYPTPLHVIEMMTEGEQLKNKTIFEPSAGLGNIVDFCVGAGANLIACEISDDLRKTLSTKCPIIGNDFLEVESHKISHIDYIIMNPPFDAADKHIIHAFNIAPPGCKIIALCNSATLENTYTATRKELKSIIDSYGETTPDLGDCFAESERATKVNVSLIKIQKAGISYKSEFEGFFMDEEPEEQGENGIMSYNVIRDLVNRFIASVKLYDKQLELAVEMNGLTKEVFFKGLPEVSMSVNRLGVPLKRNEFKNSMMKAGWLYIFEKMNLSKYTTRGVKDDINKFVEQQTNIPFSMKNIYKMLEIVVGTASQRMDRAILEAFDNITKHHSDNHYNVPGWKTNSHFLLTKKIIVPYMIDPATSYGYTSNTYNIYSHKSEMIADLEKALCFVTGRNWDEIKSVHQSANRNIYGEWYESEFFTYKGFKKGTVHLVFKDENVWAMINQKVAKLKGYPLFEGKKQTAYQNRQTGRTTPKEKKPAPAPAATSEDPKPAAPKQEFKVLSTFKIAI